MKKIPMLERFAAQSLVEYDGELIFSKEKFAELIVSECGEFCGQVDRDAMFIHFGVEDRAITKEMLEQTIARCEQQLAEKRND